MGLSLKKIGNFAQAAERQINPFDNNMTAKQTTPTASRSVVQQATHNPVTNFVGNNIVKPLGQFPLDASQQLYNHAVAPVLDLPKQNFRSNPLGLGKPASVVGADGSLHQLVGSGIQTALTIGTAGISSGVEAGAARLIPAIAPSIVRTVAPKVIGGAVVGGGFGAAGAAAQNAKPLDIVKAGVETAALGGVVPVAGSLLKALPKVTMKAGRTVVDKYKEANPVPVPHPETQASITPEVPVKPPTKQTAELKVLNSKIARVKDPVRKAELIKERAVRMANNEAPDAPNALKRAYMSTKAVIAAHGKGGAEVSHRLETARDQLETSVESAVEQIPSVMKLSKKDLATFWDAQDKLSKGKGVRTAPHIAKAIDEWTVLAPAIRDRAVKAGLDVGDLGPHYLPRTYKDIAKGSNINKLAKAMIASGDAKTKGEAMGKIRLMQRDYTRPFGNLEKHRTTNMGGYEKTHDALINYLNRSFDRITKAEQFGAKNEKLNDLRAQIQSEGFDASKNSTFDKHLKIALGDVDRTTAAYKVSGAVRKVNALRSLSMSGISNATQLTNTATVGGIGRTLKAIVKTLGDQPTRDSARQAGVLLDHTINDLAQQGLGVSGKITSNIASPFFRTIEKFNRSVSAEVGKDWAGSLAQKAAGGSELATNILREKLGVTGEIGAKLTREQEIQAARKMVEVSQFKVDPMDLPGWVDSPLGKIVAQFRTFGYKQTEFMYNQVLREALKGNLLPLTRFALVGIPAGAAALELKGVVKGNLPFNKDSNPKDVAIKGAEQVGAGGLPLSEINNLVTSAKYGNSLGGVAGTTFGPTGSVIAETATNIDKARAGNTLTLKKEAVRNIPLVGSAAVGHVFPSKATKDTEAYFASLDKAHGELKSDNKATKALDNYLARTKDRTTGKNIQNSPSESLQNSAAMFDNDKLRGVVQNMERAQPKHDPMWDLPADKLKAYFQYKEQFTGDAAKSFLKSKANMPDGSNWIQDVQDASNKFFSGLPSGKGAKPSAKTPTYPAFDQPTQDLLAAYSNGSTEQRSALQASHSGELSTAFGQIADWTNAMRKAEGAPELKDNPAADKETQAIINTYNALPQHDGSKGGNATRYAWTQAHPAEYARMQAFLTTTSMQGLIKNAALDQFKGSEPNQQLLKDIKNVGKYDIAVRTGADGKSVYSLDPSAASAQNATTSSYKAYTRSGVNKDAKYLSNTGKYMVSAPSGKIKKNTTKVTLKKGNRPKFKVASAKPKKNAKVTLKV